MSTPEESALTRNRGNLAKCRRVAYFGGSFDPPHLGHLAIARAARQALALDAVLFAPVGAQPLKPQGSSASYEDRLAMTELSIADDAGFYLSSADAPRAGGTPNYTFETLQSVRKEFPVVEELFFLMGADSLTGFRRWFRAAEIPFLASLIVAARPGESLQELQALLPTGLHIEALTSSAAAIGTASAMPLVEVVPFQLKNEEGKIARLYLLPSLCYEISATQIREQVARLQVSTTPVTEAVEGVHELGMKVVLDALHPDLPLPFPVFDYIRSRFLYQ